MHRTPFAATLLCAAVLLAPPRADAGGPLPTCFGVAATIIGAGNFKGTPGNDVIVGSNGSDAINGAGGSDRICGLGGEDVISAKKGSIQVDGGDDQGVIRVKAGGGGSSVILGGAGEDVIRFDPQGGGSNAAVGGAEPIGAA
jgi:Ca2+-binding RTX toxin-like protein